MMTNNVKRLTSIAIVFIFMAMLLVVKNENVNAVASIQTTFGSVSAHPGDSIQIPIRFSNVVQNPIGSASFKVHYDPTMFDFVSVVADTADANGIIVNPAVDFDSANNSTTGIVSFLFADASGGDRPIVKDGVFAKLNLKAKTTATIGVYNLSVTNESIGPEFGNLYTVSNVNAAITLTVDTSGYQSQPAPTGLLGVAPTTAANNDGQITGTTTAMEYKLSTATTYTAATAPAITGLAPGTYNVRFAAKVGYNAGATTDVVVGAYVAPNLDQAAPTGLLGVAPTAFGGNDGQITGTTTAMEYKLSTAATYTAATAPAITGLAAGTYSVRFAAKAGYNAGAVLSVVVPAGNQNQVAPTGLIGVAPTAYGGNDGKITGTTTAMEYKLSTDTNYIAVTGTQITGLTAGTYNVRFAAKSGYNAGTAVNVVVPAANQDQAAPTGLVGVAPTSAANNDGRITGTTIAMEYKLSTATTYTAVTGTTITGLAAGTYNVRFAAKAGFNAGTTVDVVVGTYGIQIGTPTVDTPISISATTASVKVSVVNNTSKSTEATLLVAVYDKTTNKMLKYAIPAGSSLVKGITVDPNTSIDLTATINLTGLDDVDGKYIVKCFVWNNLSSGVAMTSHVTKFTVVK